MLRTNKYLHDQRDDGIFGGGNSRYANTTVPQRKLERKLEKRRNKRDKDKQNAQS